VSLSSGENWYYKLKQDHYDVVVNVSKVKLYLQQVVEAHRFMRRRGSSHFLGNRLTDGGGVVSLMHRTLRLLSHFRTPCFLILNAIKF
jgi:hypothetical protein